MNYVPTPLTFLPRIPILRHACAFLLQLVSAKKCPKTVLKQPTNPITIVLESEMKGQTIEEMKN